MSNKVAVVTDAGVTGSGNFVGVGQAISILFARQGARVLLADREERNAEATLATIREEGGEASVFIGDVTSNDDMREMAAEAANFSYGNVNVLGINGPGSVTNVDVDSWDTVLEVNLKSVMLCSKHTIPQMIQSGGGSVVNVSSIIGLRTGGGPPTPSLRRLKGWHDRPQQPHVCVLRTRQRPGELHRPWPRAQPHGRPPRFRGDAGPAPPLRASWSRGNAVGRGLRHPVPDL